MPEFICKRCGCVDNTACGDFWTQFMKTKDPHECLCTECSTGTWHGKFLKAIPGEDEESIKKYWEKLERR